MLRSNCALLVYGKGKSLTMYFAAFLSRLSEMITCALLKSERDVGSTPATFLMRYGFGGAFLAPRPPQDPYTNM